MVQKLEMIRSKLLPTTHMLALWGLMIMTTILNGCEPGTGQQIGQMLEDALPQIYDVEKPTEPYRTSARSFDYVSFPLKATFEDNIWADKNTARSLVVFRLVEDEDQCGATENERTIFQGNKACARVIDVRNNDCEQIPDSDAERCTANVTSQTGVYYFQWLLECFDCDGGDFIVEPDPPQETFKFEVGALIDDDNDEDPPPPPVDDSLPLESRDPKNGSTCAGNYVGGPDNTGETTVTFRWHEAGGLTGTSLEGDFQILVEPAGSNGCGHAQNDNLVDIDEPNADIERPDQCIITFTNINETDRNLLPGTDYQWQVRRILDGDTAEFGPFTQPFVFTTAGYVTETPTFIDPNGNDSTNYPTQNEPPMTLNPATAISTLIQTRWTPVGCNPHSYAIELFRDGELNPSFTTSDTCFADVQTADRICEAEILVYAGSSYRLALNQQTQFGDINALLEFSVAGQP